MTKDEAIEWLLAMRDRNDYQRKEAFDMAIEALSQEVIRCKDCKYAHLTYDGNCKYCDQWKDDDDFSIELYLSSDFYCAYAERKTDRDCEHCTHHTSQGCTKWDCEFERRTDEKH